jgi:hypothetical protein
VLVAFSIFAPPRAATPILVSGQATTQTKTISVSGTGTISAAPDEAWFYAAVVTQSLSAQQALADNAVAMSRVIDRMGQLGIGKAKIETVGFSLFPVYANDGRTLIGYQVHNAIKIRVTDLTRLGEVIDAAVGAGANEVQGVQFTLSDQRAADLRAQALELAVKDASGKAQKLAGLLGVTITGPVSVQIDFAYQPIHVAAERALQPATPTPIIPGQLQVTVNVLIAYAFA